MGTSSRFAETAGFEDSGLTRVFFTDTDGNMILRVEGHSSRSTALDICSAVSILTENLEASLDLLLQRPARVVKTEGFFELQARDDPETRLLIASVLLGLRTIAKNHPNSVQVDAR
jgi:uncharacterized protein YsxB (DUF464 family)